MTNALRYVDGFIRDRGRIIGQIKKGESPGRFFLASLAMFLIFTCVYGLVMGSFRWFQPLLFFSDYVVEGMPSQVSGIVDSMDASSMTVTCKSLKPDPVLIGRQIRFNRTSPTPAYAIVKAESIDGGAKLTIEGPPMVPKDPWKFPVFSALKVPALFLVTLLVCLPALYVLNIALGWHLRFSPTAAVLMTGLASTSVMLIVLAPIVLFFTVLTDNYHFMKVLNVLVFAIAGAYGLQSVAIGLKGLHDAEGGASGLIAQAVTSYRVGKLLLVWFLLYMFVGCQMAWTLRPFIGTPYLPEFAVIRSGSSNFYVNILGSLSELGDTRR